MLKKLLNIRSRWWFWLDKRRGTYDHAHGEWFDAGSWCEPPNVEACWCPIGYDHDA